MLEWKSTPAAHDILRKWVKGVELEYCFPPGFLHRFKIMTVRVYQDGDYNKPDVKYRIYDAYTVSDFEMRRGEKSKSIGEFATLDAALAAIEKYR